MGSSISLDKRLDRKALKKQDQFTSTMGGFFDQLSSQSGRVLIGIGGVLVIGLAIAFWMNHRDAQTDASRNALFLAEKSVEMELKAMVPAASTPKDSPKDSKDAAKKKESETTGVDALVFQKFDVDAKLSKSIQLLKAVEQDFHQTRAALDARFKIAGLYFNHGEYEKALTWYQKAADSASGFDKAVALSSLAYSYENLGKNAEAIQAYEKAINLGEGSLKGDLLLGIARNYEAAHDTAKARSTYDQILKDLPNTEYARSAELSKEQLQ